MPYGMQKRPNVRSAPRPAPPPQQAGLAAAMSTPFQGSKASGPPNMSKMMPTPMAMPAPPMTGFGNPAQSMGMAMQPQPQMQQPQMQLPPGPASVFNARVPQMQVPEMGGGQSGWGSAPSPPDLMDIVRRMRGRI